MAKIKVEQETGTITVTVAGETRKDYRVTDHHITVNKADARHMLQTIPGATLAAGSTLDDDDTEDVGVYEDSAPPLPTPDAVRAEGLPAATEAAAKAAGKRT